MLLQAAAAELLAPPVDDQLLTLDRCDTASILEL
jgi:hypothetical protein